MTPYIVVVVGIALIFAVFGLVACIRSSQISRNEEGDPYQAVRELREQYKREAK